MKICKSCDQWKFGSFTSEAAIDEFKYCPFCGAALNTKSHDDDFKSPWDPEPGDYVLATKYFSGDPDDAWEVGFYDGFRQGQHYVTDGQGRQHRINGYSQVARISLAVGCWLREEFQFIVQEPPAELQVSLWGMLVPYFENEEREIEKWRRRITRVAPS